MIKTDVIIIGSGIGALSTAGKLCKNNLKITMITKGLKKACNSNLAQGGISVALSKNDNFQLHYEDTMSAGCNLNDSDSVMELVSKAPEIMQELIDEGMKFDTDEYGELKFGKEGAHRLARIIHAGGDRTGGRVVEFLLTLINENVDIHENEMVVDLRVKDGKCCGVTAKTSDGAIKKYQADYIILATGGIGQLYPNTSNDTTITGDGLAMAYRAGCRLKNLEFIQFHPTLLTINSHSYGLVSEAVRGAGAFLVNDKGERIMENILPFKDLSPRDVVSREVFNHYLKGEKIFLDITPVKNFRKEFPTVTEICEQHGVNPDDGLIPVAPGAHFHMGGVEAKTTGETSIEGLYAVGETACTGVHGANRLASNSLLEGIVFGRLLADNIINSHRKSEEITEDTSSLVLGELPTKKQIQEKMMEFLGIIRYEDKIHEIIEWFEQFSPDKKFGLLDAQNVTVNQLEIYNMLTAGWLIAKAALKRKQSIGAHYIITKQEG